MSGSPPETGDPREVMDRAIRRLGILEHLFLGLAALTALVAGALVAWLLGQAFGLPFRATWAVTALLLFVVPGGLSWWRVRRDGGRTDGGSSISSSPPSSEHGRHE